MVAREARVAGQVAGVGAGGDLGWATCGVGVAGGSGVGAGGNDVTWGSKR